MSEVVMYRTKECPYCIKAKNLFDDKNIEVKEIYVDGDQALRNKMQEISGRHTVPQIFINGEHIGGCSDLYSLEEQNKLNSMLGEE